MKYKIDTKLEIETESEVAYELVCNLINSNSLSDFLMDYIDKLTQGYTTINLKNIISRLPSDGSSEKVSKLENPIAEDEIVGKLSSVMDEKFGYLLSIIEDLKSKGMVVDPVRTTESVPPLPKAGMFDNIEEEEEDDFDFDSIEMDEGPKLEISLDDIRSINKKLSGGE